ncbi:MAG TPA: M28 family peptidase [Gemmatimonadaceae bacterium]|nr:M28 family peptidase [Gemmatimonadaceae bacterium]
MRTSITSLAVALVLPAVAGAQQARRRAPHDGGGVVPLPPTTLPLKHTPRPTHAGITAADLMTRLYIFSDDSMQGREAGTIGNFKGTTYIAGQIKQMGLIPAGDNGTYFQTIPLKSRALGDHPTFAVGGTSLEAFKDFLPLGPSSITNPSLPVVYGGVYGDTAHDISADQARGKLVVYTVKQGQNARRSMRRGASIPGAAAVAVVSLDSFPARFIPFLTRPREFLDDPSSGTSAQTPSFLITSTAAAKMFTQPLDQLTPGTAGATASVDVRYTVTPVPYPARNVVGIIRGSDPKLRGEYVAIGAHNDHIGISRRPVDHDSLRIWNHWVRPEGADDGGKRATPAEQKLVDAKLAAFRAKHPHTDRMDSINNGADDDGSGTVTALEIAQKIASMRVKPKRSMLFVWHVGEEKGLLGSQYFTDHPTVPRDSIVTQLNMDMVGRGDAYDETGRTKAGVPLHGSKGYLQLVGSRRLSTELGDLIEKVNKEDHHNLTFDYSLDANGHPSNIYCRSDHYEYARYGIPITFFTTGLHSDYHQVTDEPEYIDYQHMARVGDLVEDVAVHVADLDHRPVVDHPKPDPHGVCRQ